jgi:hypothetical protein
MARKRRRSDWAGRPPLRSPGRPPVARREHRRRFWELIARGLTSEDAGVAAGVSPAVGTRWFRDGGVDGHGKRPESTTGQRWPDTAPSRPRRDRLRDHHLGPAAASIADLGPRRRRQTPREARRCLKRRLTNHIWRTMITDEQRQAASPGGHLGATLTSSAAGSTPTTSSSDKSLPGLANHDSTTTQPANLRWGRDGWRARLPSNPAHDDPKPPHPGRCPSRCAT